MLVRRDPDSAGKSLGVEPSVDPTARVRDVRFGEYCEVGARTRIAESSIGDYSYIANDSDLIYTTVGRFCSIAAHVRSNPGNHPLQRVAMSHFTYRSSAYGWGDDEEEFFAWRRSHPVHLGHDVWVGHGAVLLPGVSIGTGAAVGAGAIVTRDVPAFAIAIGSPARVHRYRFLPETIAALQRIAWWDWPHDRLGVALTDFRHLNAEEFCARHDPGPAAE